MTITTRLMGDEEVKEVTGLTRETRFYMMRRGEFPASVRVGHRKVAWFEDEISAWLEECRHRYSITAERYWKPSNKAAAKLPEQQGEVTA